MQVKVFKFGGASVKDAPAIENLYQIMRLYPDDTVVVVISAMGKTTNFLEKVLEAYHQRPEEVPALVDELQRQHEQVAEQLVPDPGSIVDSLARYDVEPGDVFFLPAGRIHAICGGCFIAEIQQTSDITYRIYDYNRPGLDGKPRELHTALAKDAIDYKVYADYQTHYTPAEDEEVELVSCPYFTTSLLDLSLPYAKDLSELDSFVVAMCLEGSGTLEVDGEEVCIGRGETILIPASADDLCLVPDACLKVLLSYVP